MLRAQDISDIKKINPKIDLRNEKSVVIYRVAGVKPETIPGNKRKEIVPFYKNVPSVDQVFDGENNLHNIAFVSNVDTRGNVRFGKIQFLAAANGYIFIDPRKPTPRHIKMYEYLETTNYNGSKEGRDESKEIIFTRIKAENNAEIALAAEALIIEAKMLVMGADDADIRKLAYAIGTEEVSEDKGISTVRNNIIKGYCMTTPQTVISTLKSANLSTETMLKTAVKHNILTNIKVKGNPKARIEFAGSTIFEYDNQAGVPVYSLLAKYLDNENKEMLEKVQSAVTMREMAEKEKAGA